MVVSARRARSLRMRDGDSAGFVAEEEEEEAVSERARRLRWRAVVLGMFAERER